MSTIPVKNILSALSVVGAGLLMVSCDNDNTSNDAPTEAAVDSQLAAIIIQHNLTGDPADGRLIPEIDSPMAQLGKALFFSKSLGGEFDSACVSCHHPALGGGDNLSLPVGVDAVDSNGNKAADIIGLGRYHSIAGNVPSVPRNAPTTFNVALQDNSMFWDSRIESIGKEIYANGAESGIITPDSLSGGEVDSLLEAGMNLTAAQARFPVTSAEEMRADFEQGEANEVLRASLIARLQSSANWQNLFTNAFGDPTITFNRIAIAIAFYENSQTFTNNAWKAYIEGTSEALTDEQKQGAILFFTDVSEGGAGCAGCHSGDLFSDHQHHLLAFPQIGPGKGDDSGNGPTHDFGRARETGDILDRYHFRTPNLLNIEVTGPYGHAGSYQNLEDTIRHHLDPAASIDDFFGVVNGIPFTSNAGLCELPQVAQLLEVSVGDCADLYTNAYADTVAALEAMDSNSANSALTERARLSEQQIVQVIAFLTALTDPCVKDRSCLNPWIIDADDVASFPDDQALLARDENGNEL